MSLVVLMAVWVVVLGLVAIVLWRDVRILQARVGRGGMLVTNGIEIGAPQPRVARSKAASNIVFLTSDCDVCVEVADDLRRVRAADALTVVVGGVTEDAAGVIDLLPPRATLISGVDAAEWQSAFDVKVAPFAVRVENGLVTAKGHLRSADDVDALTGADR